MLISGRWRALLLPSTAFHPRGGFAGYYGSAPVVAVEGMAARGARAGLRDAANGSARGALVVSFAVAACV